MFCPNVGAIINDFNMTGRAIEKKIFFSNLFRKK